MTPGTDLDRALAAIGAAHARHLARSAEGFEAFLALLREQAVPAASPDPRPAPAASADRDEQVLDPLVDTWLWDHQPSHVIPVAPGFWILGQLAAAALRQRPGAVVVGVDDVSLKSWLVCREPVRLRARAWPLGDDRYEVVLERWRAAQTAALSRFEPVARGVVTLASGYARGPGSPWPPPRPATALPDPYRSTFLGPAFQLLTACEIGRDGAEAVLDPARSGLDGGAVGWDLLDASTHPGVPRARRIWFPDLDDVALPLRIDGLTLHGPPPRGPVRVQMRVAREPGARRVTVARVRLWRDDALWAAYTLEQALLPVRVPHDVCEAFFGRRAFVPGVGHSVFEPGATRLALADVVALDWLPGTLAAAYGLRPHLGAEALACWVAAKDHVGQRLGVHPSRVSVPDTLDRGSAAGQTLRIACCVEGDEVVVRDLDPPGVRDAAGSAGATP